MTQLKLRRPPEIKALQFDGGVGTMWKWLRENEMVGVNGPTPETMLVHQYYPNQSLLVKVDDWVVLTIEKWLNSTKVEVLSPEKFIEKYEPVKEPKPPAYLAWDPCQNPATCDIHGHEKVAGLI